MEYIYETSVPQSERCRLSIQSAAFTRQGKHREVNEDAVFHWSDQAETGPSVVGLGIVCDGLGGQQAGEVASRLAIEIVSAELIPVLRLADGPSDDRHPQFSAESLGEWIKAAIAKANSRIHRYTARGPGLASMATTITLAAITDDAAQVANVGDGRTYHWRVGRLTQVTQDHSLVASLVKMGRLSEAEAATHPRHNLILRALGSESAVKPDLFSLQLEPGDKLLLCSDGFWKAFPDPADLGSWLEPEDEPAELCRRLAAESHRRSGTDDHSVILFAVS